MKPSIYHLSMGTKKEEQSLPLTSDKLTVSFLRRLVFPPALKTLVFLPVAAVLGVIGLSIRDSDKVRAQHRSNRKKDQSLQRRREDQPSYLPVAAVLGAHLIAITNGEPYYAVMKKAPAVGTIS
jgi:hypothetical protein